MSGTAIYIDPLGTDNYNTWKIHIEALLEKNDTWEYLSGISIRPTETEAARLAGTEQTVKLNIKLF